MYVLKRTHIKELADMLPSDISDGTIVVCPQTFKRLDVAVGVTCARDGDPHVDGVASTGGVGRPTERAEVGEFAFCGQVYC